MDLVSLVWLACPVAKSTVRPSAVRRGFGRFPRPELHLNPAYYICVFRLGRCSFARCRAWHLQGSGVTREQSM